MCRVGTRGHHLLGVCGLYWSTHIIAHTSTHTHFLIWVLCASGHLHQGPESSCQSDKRWNMVWMCVCVCIDICVLDVLCRLCGVSGSDYSLDIVWVRFRVYRLKGSLYVWAEYVWLRKWMKLTVITVLNIIFVSVVFGFVSLMMMRSYIFSQLWVTSSA